MPARVLWLTKGLGLGGTEHLMAWSLPHIDRTRFSVEVAYLLPWKDALVPAIREQDIPVHCLDYRHVADLRWAVRFRRLVRERAFDVVHTQSPYAAIGARLAAPGVRFVHTEHNVWSRYRRLTAWANARTYGRNDAVIAVSQAVADSVTAARKAVRPPISVIRHGVNLPDPPDADARDAARAALGLQGDGPVVGTVGNLTPKKDHATLLAAAARLAPAWPGLRIVVVGSGPLEADLRAEASALGLRDVVLFAGARSDVADLLPAFDVFVLSSRHEGLPIALLEAMAAGVSVVATAVGGVPEVLADPAAGRLVPHADPPALAAAVHDLLADDQLRARTGKQGAAVAGSFDLGEAVGRTMAVYDKVLR